MIKVFTNRDGELWRDQRLRLVRHVLQEHASISRPQHLRQHVLVVVLGLGFLVPVPVAQALFAVVVGGRERLVQHLEVVALHEYPLERRRERTRHAPRAIGFGSVIPFLSFP
jgi:hypothetical protein